MGFKKSEPPFISLPTIPLTTIPISFKLPRMSTSSKQPTSRRRTKRRRIITIHETRELEIELSGSSDGVTSSPLRRKVTKKIGKRSDELHVLRGDNSSSGLKAVEVASGPVVKAVKERERGLVFDVVSTLRPIASYD